MNFQNEFKEFSSLLLNKFAKMYFSNAPGILCGLLSSTKRKYAESSYENDSLFRTVACFIQNYRQGSAHTHGKYTWSAHSVAHPLMHPLAIP
jgi:hypothetical protein